MGWDKHAKNPHGVKLRKHIPKADYEKYRLKRYGNKFTFYYMMEQLPLKDHPKLGKVLSKQDTKKMLRYTKMYLWPATQDWDYFKDNKDIENKLKTDPKFTCSARISMTLKGC